MADVITWVGDVLSIDVATLGTVTVTPGLILASAMIFGLATRAAKRLKGLG